MSRYCPSCREVIHEVDRVCPFCGYDLEQWEKEKMSKETVIAKGKVEKSERVPGYFVGNVALGYIDLDIQQALIPNKVGKTIEIIIREVTNQD